MTNLDKSAIAVFLIIIFAGMSFVIYDLKKQSDFWFSLVDYHKKKHDYFFEGANLRNLIDICENANGDIDIWFKEDCIKGTEKFGKQP